MASLMIRPVVLLVTTDNKPEALAVLRRMLETVESYIRSANAAPVTVFLLLQNATGEGVGQLRAILPEWVVLKQVDRRVSLSRARNILLTDPEVVAAMTDDTIVGFPDDDCWFPQGTLARIAWDFASDDALDLWFCRYGSDAQDPKGAPCRSPRLQSVISRASSNTMYLRAAIVKRVGPFDETLGVGAPINGGEDTDFALRAYRLARTTLFLDAKAVGHRDFNPLIKARYYPGSLVAILRFARGGSAGYPAAARKILIGSLLLLQGKISPADMAGAIRQAFRPVLSSV